MNSYFTSMCILWSAYTSITERLHDGETSDLIRDFLLVDNLFFLAEVVWDAVVLHLVQLLRLHVLTQNPFSDTIWDLSQTVGGMYMCRNSEYLVQFFQSLTLGFTDEQKNEDPEDAGVKNLRRWMWSQQI